MLMFSSHKKMRFSDSADDLLGQISPECSSVGHIPEYSSRVQLIHELCWGTTPSRRHIKAQCVCVLVCVCAVVPSCITGSTVCVEVFRFLCARICVKALLHARSSPPTQVFSLIPPDRRSAWPRPGCRCVHTQTLVMRCIKCIFWIKPEWKRE